MSSRESVLPESSDGDFSVEVWRRLVTSLRAAEPTFDRLAAQGGLRLLSSARWPELRLQRRVRWTTRELRLTMMPGHANREYGSPVWAIEYVEYPRFAWLRFGESRVDRFAELSDDDLRAGLHLEELVQTGLHRLNVP